MTTACVKQPTHLFRREVADLEDGGDQTTAQAISAMRLGEWHKAAANRAQVTTLADLKRHLTARR